MILLIDNYDSFSYNLYQYIGAICSDVKAVRNDQITVDEIRRLKPSHLVLSPGPGFPKDAGICLDAAKKLEGKMPILGVCLGHQTIGEAYGGKVVHAPKLMHGKTSKIKLNTDCQLFKGMPQIIEAARYHSLVVEKNSLPDCLQITATDSDGEIMGLKHKDYPTYGIQFHPESFMTQNGLDIIKNFLNIH